jgi:hypothetical protein
VTSRGTGGTPCRADAAFRIPHSALRTPIDPK